MKHGNTIPRFITPRGAAGIGPELASMARDAEQGGLDSLWVMDHFFQIPPVGEIDEPLLEGYSALAFAAGVTERITLGIDHYIAPTVDRAGLHLLLEEAVPATRLAAATR